MYKRPPKGLLALLITVFMLSVLYSSASPVQALNPQPEPPAPLFPGSLLNPGSLLEINPQPEPPGISVLVDGLKLDMDVSPVIESGRTLVPMRAIFENFGAEVQWFDETRTIIATKGDVVLTLQIGNPVVMKNGQPIQLEAAPRILNDRTMVPLRFVGEALGATVDWEDASRTVKIVKPVESVIKLPDINRPPLVTLPKPGSNLTLKPKTVLDKSTTFLQPQDDYAAILKDKNLARPIQAVEIPVFKPARMDFSPYVTFVGNQDGWGGCIGRSIVHVMNILNEMENPYTPDLSLWYLHARQLQLFPNGNPDTKFVLEQEGLCSEASLPTNYDNFFRNTDESDNWSAMQYPTMANYIEAKGLYRVLYPNQPISPDVETIKSLMVKHGPLLAGGPFTIIQGENPAEYHCVTIIGYDDSLAQFSCLNSWGDWKHGGDGIFEVPYDKVADNISSVKYIEDLPSPREITGHAYTGRINLDGQYALRRNLTVKVGVEGRDPITIWDSPNQVQCVDSSYDLCLDFALPEYADECWPPASSARWYIEIKNDNQVWVDEENPQYCDGVFFLKEFTLARLYEKDAGGLTTETFSANDKVGTMIKDGVTRIYIPAQAAILKPGIITPIRVQPLQPRFTLDM